MNHPHHHGHALAGPRVPRRHERMAHAGDDQPRSLLASPAFWLGGAASLAIWAAIAFGVMRWG